MKRSDLEKELRREAETHTPDVYGRVLSSARREGLLTSAPAEAEEKRTEIPHRNQKRRIGVRIAAVTAAAAACLAIALPVALAGRGSGDRVPEVLSVEDVYGLGAVTTSKLLGSEFAGGSAQNLSSVRLLAERSDPLPKAKAQASKFHEYFSMLDGFFGGSAVKTTVVSNDSSEGICANYERKLTITGTDMSGTAVQYEMYYNETVEEEDEEETEYSLDGIMFIDGEDYVLRGERKHEEDGGEREDEIVIRAYPDFTDGETYVQMEQKVSVDGNETEKEYVYSVFSDGDEIEETVVKFESEKKGAKEKAEFELEFRRGGAKGKYSAERERSDGKIKMKVKYEIEDEKGEFYVSDSSGGGYEYLFSDGSRQIFQ